VIPSVSVSANIPLLPEKAQAKRNEIKDVFVRLKMQSMFLQQKNAFVCIGSTFVSSMQHEYTTRKQVNRPGHPLPAYLKQREHPDTIYPASIFTEGNVN